MAQQPSGGQTDWKQKYLAALDDQEIREQSQQQLTFLLMRAVVRISLIADGVDDDLDKQLAGLRQMLRDGKPSDRDLNTVVDALDGQAKRLDVVKTERTRTILKAFESLVAQLSRLSPDKTARYQLKQLERTLKSRAARIQEYASLINEYAKVQKLLLQDSGELRLSKPFWHRWAPGEVQPAGTGAAAEAAEAAEQEKPVQPAAKVLHEPSAHKDASPQNGSSAAAEANDGLDLSDNVTALLEAIDPQAEGVEGAEGEEPPFSRLNAAVCAILGELLKQIESPPMARENYLAAQKQLAKGLNWYELVPVLEDISIVVVSAFDNYQKEFETFLSRLNQRLTEAYDFIHASKSVHDDGTHANRELRDSMQAQVSAMHTSVVNATNLDQLKSEVSQRLERIVSAMDEHASAERERGSSLSDQLDALVARVKTMEAASADAEKRIEEQRQKALRDVLTQLPNREAYEQRLEQEFARWQRYQRPLAMAVCDVDHFKPVNDTYGHLAGDKVLRILARTLKKRLRKTDFIARYGGEEFVILMPETSGETALKVVEGVREAIANCPFHFKEQPVKITTSFGVSEFRQGDEAEAVFVRADRALYQAKDQGRNRCVIAPHLDDSPLS